MEGQQITNLRYACGNTLLATSEEEVQVLLHCIEMTSVSFELAFTSEKRKM